MSKKPENMITWREIYDDFMAPMRPGPWMILAEKLGFDVTSTQEKREDFFRNFNICLFILWLPVMLLAVLFFIDLYFNIKNLLS